MLNKLSKLTLLLLFPVFSVISSPLSVKEEAEISAKVERLVAQMTLEEKVGQMRIFHANKGVEASESNELILSEVVQEKLKYGIAGIKNPGEFLSPEQAAIHNNLLQKYIIENSRLGIPALFITEAYNGVDATGTTRFSRPLNMAATWNEPLVEQVWDTIGREARLRGLHICHSPEADIMRDPRFGRMSEAYSEDTYLTTRMVVAAVNGVQGRFEGLSAGTHIGAVTKHFAGYGQVEGGRNFASIQISERTLIDEIFPPFKAAVQEAHTLGIMASHGDLNGIASHGNKALLTDLLRDQWGFSGYTVSDSNDIARLHYFMGVAETPDDAALMGLDAGLDIDLYSEDAYAYLPRLARENPAIVEQIDNAVRRVLRVKFILGLFDNPFIDVSKVAAAVRNEQSLSLAHEADLESIILLRNANNTLPLENINNATIGLIGPLVGDNTEQQFREVLGDTQALVVEPGFSLTDEQPFEPRLLTNSENQEGFDNAINAAKQSDVIVLFLGGDKFTAKEAYFARGLGDRASIQLVGLQNTLVEQVSALGKPVIVVLKHRRTLAIPEVNEHADAILDTWDLSEQGDLAVAKMLIGEAIPSGKLPVTVPRHIGQLPFHYSQKNINFKKEYMFLGAQPLYPFGFGLSYTTFNYSDLVLSKNEVSKDESFTVSVTVTNTGNYHAKEVVQLYIQDVIGSVIRPAKELKGFEKISLAPNESRMVSFTITPDMLAFTGLDMETKVEAGDFVVEVGTSSADTLTETFTVTP
ncbi:glycoside hydrolase family 3 N-terminal domain-containing protein [Alteromonas sp. KUL49]|uniref:glycoside hydrolase family 3 N-terminal domain-containing protein n=1 Tax=Alteromonas sp. KUL49 TaxID=2480798 RepID=UPI00102F2846|nr:glycoside hydrolase family 3 N-terminal domain-containing protein [Alteromonas sp. KUL49]TAP42270.1 beta-glucosidase [Alteromonas sp. KUL49]GEA09864.1 beta-glucosidase [Alteromonas sp. KUL49]